MPAVKQPEVDDLVTGLQGRWVKEESGGKGGTISLFVRPFGAFFGGEWLYNIPEGAIIRLNPTHGTKIPPEGRYYILEHDGKPSPVKNDILKEHDKSISRMREQMESLKAALSAAESEIAKYKKGETEIFRQHALKQRAVAGEKIPQKELKRPKMLAEYEEYEEG